MYVRALLNGVGVYKETPIMGPVLYTCTINVESDKYGASKKTIFEKLKVH